MAWVEITAERALYVATGRETIVCDRGFSGPVTLLVKIGDRNATRLARSILRDVVPRHGLHGTTARGLGFCSVKRLIEGQPIE